MKSSFYFICLSSVNIGRYHQQSILVVWTESEAGGRRGGGRHHSSVSGVAGVVVLLCPVSQLLLSESEQRSSHGRQARSHRGPLRQVRTLDTGTIYLRNAHME